MDIRFCPSCGTERREGAGYCVTCGHRLGSDSFAPPSVEDYFATETSRASGYGKTSTLSSDAFLKICLVLVALSPIPAIIELNNSWYWIENAQMIWIVSVFLPALMVAIPLLGERKFLGIVASDARFTVLSSVTAFFVALRATGALADGDFPHESQFVLSQLIGLLGFAVLGITFPWKKPVRSWFAEDFNPVHISMASLGAITFVALRNSNTWQFIFSPASISGPSILEYVFLALLVAAGFMASPWRQFVAISIGSLSILSFTANVLFLDGPIRPWPNPVTFACCLALCFPWQDMADPDRKSF